MTDWYIRPMHAADCSAAVEVHLLAFQGFFLTFLGSRFLGELYSAILDDPSGKSGGAAILPLIPSSKDLVKKMFAVRNPLPFERFPRLMKFQEEDRI